LNNIPTALHWWIEESKQLDGDSQPDCCVGKNIFVIFILYLYAMLIAYIRCFSLGVAHKLIPGLEKHRNAELAERKEKRKKQHGSEKENEKDNKEEKERSNNTECKYYIRYIFSYIYIFIYMNTCQDILKYSITHHFLRHEHFSCISRFVAFGRSKICIHIPKNRCYSACSR